jgi:hypothetical protein
MLAGLGVVLLVGLSLLALRFLVPDSKQERDEADPEAVPITAPGSVVPTATTWMVLLRSDDPAIWNSDSPGTKFAVPVRQAPADTRYLRLKRLDTGEVLILPVSREDLLCERRPASMKGNWWNGTAREEHGGRHLGIVQAPRFRWPNHRGVISVADEGWDAYCGSGFGAKCQFNDGQYQCWHGQEIPRTVLEIAVTAGPLTEAETRALLK